MLSKFTWGTLTLLLLPVALLAQAADGRFSEYPGGPDLLSWLSDASRSDVSRFGDSYRRHAAGRDVGRSELEAPAFSYRYPYHPIPYSYQAYATGPADWTRGYSYPYGYASSWYPYSSWRGLGDDNAFPDYDHIVYSPIPGVHGAPIEEGYRAGRTYRQTYGATGTFTASLTSSITVMSPPRADIYLQGVKVTSGDAAAVHRFQTPPLTAEQQYRYQVRAVWAGPDGRPVDQSQEVDFAAGDGVAVRFPAAQTTTRTMQAIEK